MEGVGTDLGRNISIPAIRIATIGTKRRLLIRRLLVLRLTVERTMRWFASVAVLDQTKEWIPSNTPPMTSNRVSCVFFQDGPLVLYVDGDLIHGVYDIHGYLWKNKQITFGEIIKKHVHYLMFFKQLFTSGRLSELFIRNWLRRCTRNFIDSCTAKFARRFESCDGRHYFCQNEPWMYYYLQLYFVAYGNQPKKTTTERLLTIIFFIVLYTHNTTNKATPTLLS